MITDKDIQDFLRITKRLAAFNTELQKRHPGANIYLEEDTLHLMAGPSHDEKERPQQHNIVASQWLRGSGGGAW